MFFFFGDEPVMNNLNSTNLQYIKINNLFGRNNVVVNFEKEVNIFIGENGLGKTTILNCVYYILKKKYDKLASIEFEEIIVKLKDYNKEFSINKNDIREYNFRKMPRNRYYHDARLIENIIADYIDELSKFRFDEENLHLIIRKISRMTDMPMSLIHQYVYEYLDKGTLEKARKKGDYKKVESLNDAVDKSINQRILYLTTYRRIENDFSKLMESRDGYKENDLLIKFGMSDVENSIESILNLIRENAREGFNKMTGVLLKQYASSTNSETYQSNHKKIDKDMLKIIFDRLGNEIAESDKNKIFALLDCEEIYNANYSYLFNLIIKLIDNYEKQKIYDDKIKNFVDTCNKYLNNKKFIYNQSELKLYVRLETEEEYNIELANLSSGEKQIVSLFSKLYLENEKESILIIDEPELSISMKWQKMLLPDVMRSGNCKLLLTVTHSPFIFENEFDMDAKEMRHCISNL